MTPTPMRCALVAVLLALAGCAVRESAPVAPRGAAAPPAVARPAVPAVPPPATATSATSAAPRGAPAMPADALYVCVSEADGQHSESVIEFTPKVGELCRRHPEMGPCQYERETCRQRGGRVFAAGGVEITRETEAEYDRKVMRVRFKSN
jgi:hypothetical protein